MKRVHHSPLPTFALLACALLAIFANPVRAGTRTIDRRKYTDRSGSRYFVIFAARTGSWTGHAFVVWAAQDSHRRMSSARAFGFYPAENGREIFYRRVPSELRNEALDPRSRLISQRLIVEVNREEYYASQAAIRRWETRRYNLFTRNCISFVIDVANRIGLRTPWRGASDLPSSYIYKLSLYNRR